MLWMRPLQRVRFVCDCAERVCCSGSPCRACAPLTEGGGNTQWQRQGKHRGTRVHAQSVRRRVRKAVPARAHRPRPARVVRWPTAARARQRRARLRRVPRARLLRRKLAKPEAKPRTGRHGLTRSPTGPAAPVMARQRRFRRSRTRSAGRAMSLCRARRAGPKAAASRKLTRRLQKRRATPWKRPQASCVRRASSHLVQPISCHLHRKPEGRGGETPVFCLRNHECSRRTSKIQWFLHCAALRSR